MGTISNLLFDMTVMTRSECIQIENILSDNKLNSCFEDVLKQLAVYKGRIEVLESENELLQEEADLGWKDSYDDLSFDYDSLMEEHSSLEYDFEKLEESYTTLKEEYKEMLHRIEGLKK